MRHKCGRQVLSFYSYELGFYDFVFSALDDNQIGSSKHITFSISVVNLPFCLFLNQIKPFHSK